MSYETTRKEYSGKLLTAPSNDPFDIFGSWYEAACDAGTSEPNAMSLATATKGGRPSVRIVLLKGVQDGGFSFFTNYNSRKGKEIEENPQGALCWYWEKPSRQIRAVGKIVKLNRETSDQYFQKRPRGAQIAAIVSEQSKGIQSREELETIWLTYSERNHNTDLDCPEFWGGYHLIPDEIEFWQGMRDRLHERILYTKGENHQWRIQRLQP